MSRCTSVAPLCSYKKGSHLLLESIGLESSEAQRLRDLGLREGANVSVIQNTDKMIVCVAECRIGLRRELAMHVLARDRTF